MRVFGSVAVLLCASENIAKSFPKPSKLTKTTVHAGRLGITGYPGKAGNVAMLAWFEAGYEALRSQLSLPTVANSLADWHTHFALAAATAGWPCWIFVRFGKLGADLPTQQAHLGNFPR